MLTTVFLLSLGMAWQDWYTFEPETKTFRVELPKKPGNTSSRTINNAAGPSQLTTAELKISDSVYLIQVTENNGKVDPRTLDDGIRQFAASRKATLGPIREITVDDKPGREFEVTENQKRSKMRWVMSGNALFMLSVSGKPGAQVPADADRFLGSLEIGAAKMADRAPAKPEEVEVAEAPAKEKEKDKAADTVEEKTKAASKTAAAKTPARKSGGSSKVTLGNMPRNAKFYEAEEVQDLGRSFANDREAFREVGPVGSVLVGFRASYIERFGGPKVRSLQPIYRSGQNHYLGRIHGEVVPPVTTVIARPGYAIGGLVTHTGLTLDGFGIVFMKFDGDRLDPSDNYKSAWIGDEKGGGPGEVFSNGAVVVGFHGKAGNEVNGISLTALK